MKGQTVQAQSSPRQPRANFLSRPFCRQQSRRLAVNSFLQWFVNEAETQKAESEMVREPTSLKATLFNCNTFCNLDNGNLRVRDKGITSKVAVTGGSYDGRRRLKQES